jgi:hypothetical protein
MFNYFECKECGLHFPVSEFSKCRRHLMDPEWSDTRPAQGVYRCCNLSVLAFQPFTLFSGCHYFQHVPTLSIGKNYELFIKNRAFILWKEVELTEKSQLSVKTTPVKPELLVASQTLFFHSWRKLKNNHSSIEETIANTTTSYSQKNSKNNIFDQRRHDEMKMKKLTEKLLLFKKVT